MEVAPMATVEECERAMHELAGKLAGNSGTGVRNKIEDRSLSCEIRDLKVVYAGRLHGGTLTDIRQVKDTRAQIRLSMTSDDLLALTQGNLNLGRAWATGRIRISASVFDLIKLRAMF
jgi:predicted lipid carrier protein YhbT